MRVPAASTLTVFALASLAVLLVPGPAVLHIVARSGAQGVRAGVVSVLGVHAGSVLHVVAAGAGLLYLVIGLVTDSVYAVLGAGIGRRMRLRSGRLRGRRPVEGCLLIGLGVAAIAAPHRRPAAG